MAFSLSGVAMVSRSRLEVSLEGPFDPSVGFFGFPAVERLGQDRQDLGRLEVADDHELAVVGPEVSRDRATGPGRARLS